MLEARIRLAAAGGVAARTLRRVAPEVGVEAKSHNGHVTHTDDLLDEMVGIVVGELEAPEVGRRARRLAEAGAQSGCAWYQRR